MPATYEVRLWDDLDWKENVRTPADGVVPLALDGRHVELYLSAARKAELAALLEPWFTAGHKPGSVKPGSVKPAQPGEVRPPRDRSRMRAWVDAHHIRNRKDPDLPAYMTATGSDGYWPGWLDKMFDEWEAAGCPPPPAGADSKAG